MKTINLIIILYLLKAVLGKSSLAQKYRLSKDILPDLYDIYIKPYLRPEDGDKQFTFNGQVNITLHAIENNIKEITLHKKFIQIYGAMLYRANGPSVQKLTSESMYYDSHTDKVKIILTRPLVMDKNYTLHLKYHGRIRNGMEGFYRATDDNVNWYGITQLQRINARTVFPCFDEPAFKAKFRMHISRRKEYNSVFNTRLIKSTIEGPDNYVDHFEETPLMSTYLVAFIISDFQSYGNADFELVVNTKLKNKTYFAHEVGLKTLAAFDNYTQLPYKSLGNSIMQKAGSSHFRYIGMENWGLVLYKDSVLVQDPGYTDGWSDKEYTITILAHEISHMWFGNSVTFKWWSYFWLNEAFARYYQYHFAQELYPEYELDKQFVIKEIQRIFDTDATKRTQPLSSREVSINTPAQIAYKFSGITYAKGAAIVRMFANLMGKEKFKEAMREYLKENHLKNVEPKDLFKYLKKHWPPGHQVDLYEFFRDWTDQVGYPVVSVSLSSKGRFTLTQKRFLLDPNDGSDGSIRYTIPISFNNAAKQDYNDFTPSFYFNKTLQKVEIGTAEHNQDWVIVNAQQSNYLRVFYNSDLLMCLRTALEQHNHSGIHVSNRANIVDDLFAFGRAGLKSYEEIFEFIKYLATETEYTPWYAAFKGLHLVYVRSTLKQHEEFAKFLYEVLDKVYKQLGFENTNDTILDVYNRNNVISWLCKYHHEDCNTQAQHIFHSHMSAHTRPSPDFRQALYCAACRNDESDIYENLKQMFKKEQLITEKTKILRAMGCSRYNLESHYKFVLSKSVPQDLKTIGLSSLYIHTPENIMTALKLMTANVEVLAKALKSWSATAYVIRDMSVYLTTQEQLNILERFIGQKVHLFGSSAKTLKNSLKTTKRNVKWADRHLNKLFDYLGQRNIAAPLCSDLSYFLLLLRIIM